MFTATWLICDYRRFLLIVIQIAENEPYRGNISLNKLCTLVVAIPAVARVVAHFITGRNDLTSSALSADS